MSEKFEYGKHCCQSESCYSTIISERQFAPLERRCLPMSAIDQLIVAALKQLNKENRFKAFAYLEDMLNSSNIPPSFQETEEPAS